MGIKQALEFEIQVLEKAVNISTKKAMFKEDKLYQAISRDTAKMMIRSYQRVLDSLNKGSI